MVNLSSSILELPGGTFRAVDEVKLRQVSQSFDKVVLTFDSSLRHDIVSRDIIMPSGWVIYLI